MTCNDVLRLAKLMALQSIHWSLRYGHFCEKNSKIVSNFKIKTCHFTLINYSHSCSNVSTAGSTSIRPLVPDMGIFVKKHGKIASNFKMKTCHFTLINYSHSCSNISTADSTSIRPLVPEIWAFL